MATAETTHIEIDEKGAARIMGTTTKVIEVVADYKYWGWTPDIIHRQYPYLSLAQIHAAFVYYYDHQEELNTEMQDCEKYVEEMRAQSQETAGRKKLRDQGLRQ